MDAIIVLALGSLASINQQLREKFKEQVLAEHDVNEEALDTMLEEAGEKARELVRLIS